MPRSSTDIRDALVFGAPDSFNVDSYHEDGEQAGVILIVDGEAFLVTVEPLKEDDA